MLKAKICQNAHDYMCGNDPVHFKGKDAVGHVVEAQVGGILSKAEIHGEEAPDHIAAGADTARELGLFALLFWTLFYGVDSLYTLFAFFILGWTVWRTGRSAWLSWARLERLHRIVAEEKWEIDHHRDQEREELKALYEAKGFTGKLLDEVIDVLMSDGDRLLRVMLEEELGLTLENQQHPLQIAIGSLAGALISFALTTVGYFTLGFYGVLFAGLFSIGVASGLLAHYNKNRITPAVLWNLGLAVLAWSFAVFLLQAFENL